MMAVNFTANMDKPDGRAVVQAVKLITDLNAPKDDPKENQGKLGDEMARALLRAEAARRVDLIDDPAPTIRDEPEQ
jgi:hypothetical protein